MEKEIPVNEIRMNERRSFNLSDNVYVGIDASEFGTNGCQELTSKDDAKNFLMSCCSNPQVFAIRREEVAKWVNKHTATQNLKVVILRGC
jgi:hypothetical protein